MVLCSSGPCPARWTSIAVVTSPFHQLRSGLTFRCAAKDVYPPLAQPQVCAGLGVAAKQGYQPRMRMMLGGCRSTWPESTTSATRERHGPYTGRFAAPGTLGERLLPSSGTGCRAGCVDSLPTIPGRYSTSIAEGMTTLPGHSAGSASLCLTLSWCLMQYVCTAML